MGIIFGPWRAKESASSAAPRTLPTLSVDTIRVEARPFQETLAATGSLLAGESVQIQPEVSGTITGIFLEEGSPKKKGDVLVKIDDSELVAQKTRAQAQLALDASTEKRARELLSSRGISQAEYELSVANLGIAKAELDLIEARLAKTAIKAPFDGIAGLRNLSMGSYVTPGTTICSFQAIDPLKLDFSIPERYLDFVRAGQSINFRVSGRSENFAATIYAIEPQVDAATRSLIIRALVPNPDRKLLPGSFAEITLTLDEDQSALLVPPIALIPGLKTQSVFVVENGQVARKEVQAGIRTADAIQILSGLAPGDEVITSGILQLRPGMKVQTRAQDASAPQATSTPADS